MPGKIFKYCRRLVYLGIALLLALLGASPFYIYAVFNQEIPVARLRFEQTGDSSWVAEITQGDFCTPRYYPLQGDQFQLDAGFVKWKGPAVLLGFEPRYRLDRLSGRYSDTQVQNARHPEAHDLAPDVLFDFFGSTPDGAEGLFMDTRFGSSVYMAINPGLRFSVFATEDALIVRSEPVQEFTRTDEGLQIAINRGCGSSNPPLHSLSTAINDLVLALFQPGTP